MNNKVSISFYGGAQEVTGACYLLETPKSKILIDCGLFQGYRFADEKNKELFPFDASELDALIITHAHIDHIGRIPKLYKEGFRGKIYSTFATKDIFEVSILDAFMLMENESRHEKEEPIYSKEDLEGSLKLFNTLEYHRKTTINDVTFELLNAGHILGSSFIKIEIGGKKILFSGDIGHKESVLLPPHDDLRDINFLVIESAYGKSTHKHIQDKALFLERAIEDVTRQKGVLMIPVFATERTQDILFEINSMLAFKRIPEIPVFLDSPLAIKITGVFKKHTELYTDEVKNLLKEHRHLFDFKHLKMSETKEDSMAINEVPPPKVVLAGSGMMTGGRIQHHLIRYLPDLKSILLIVGWQAAGSIGRRILDKAPEVKIRGVNVPVKADIRIIDGYSAHADEPELRDVISKTKDTLEKVFVVQGEPDAAISLAQNIKDHFGIWAKAPTYGEKYELNL